MIDLSRVSILLGAYGTAPGRALQDPGLLLRVQEYRRLLGSRMTALPREDLKQRFPAGEYHVSRKVDGEFTVLVKDGGRLFTLNPGGTVRVGLPFLPEAQERLEKAGVKRGLVAGELFVERPDGKRPRVHDVSQIARNPSSAEELGRLRFAVFDLIETDGKPPGPAFAETWRRIESVFAGGRAVRPVEAAWAKSGDEIDARFEAWVVGEGAEGIVVRSDTMGLFKAKPRHTLDAAVIGFSEGVEDRTGMLHDLLVALQRDDGTFHVFSRVGGGFTDDDRRGFLSDLKDLAAQSDYAEVNPDHLAYQMVRPEWVVEVSCLDLVSQTTRGGPIDRMVLNWDGKAGRYEALRRLPLASALSPNFVRRREDKAVRPSDLRLKQVTDLVEVPFSERDARGLAPPKSEVQRREVYTKILKGQTMVRKFLLWKTNKEEDPSFPAFVLHFTDFSPNRKTPLEREIRVSNSREQMDLLWKELAEENIGKGWNPAP